MNFRFRFCFRRSSRVAATFLCFGLGTATAAAQGGIPGYVILPLNLLDRANQATIRAEVNGQRTMLLIDTGAPRTVLDSAFYRGSLLKTGEVKSDELPPELRKKTNANGQRAAFAIAGNLKVGSLDLGKRPVVLTDLGDTMGRYNHYHAKAAVSGLLGEDLLHEYAALIDWRRHGIYLNFDKSKRRNFGPGLIAAGWTAVPMALTDGHHFSVEATVEGTKVRLLVDTGAQFSAFATGIVKFSHMLYHMDNAFTGSRLRSTAMPMTMINSSAVAYPARINHWKLGNYEIETSVVTVSSMPSGFLKERSVGEGPVLGFLGAEVLSANNAIIDVASSTLYLKASKR